MRLVLFKECNPWAKVFYCLYDRWIKKLFFRGFFGIVQGMWTGNHSWFPGISLIEWGNKLLKISQWFIIKSGYHSCFPVCFSRWDLVTILTIPGTIPGPWFWLWQLKRIMVGITIGVNKEPGYYFWCPVKLSFKEFLGFHVIVIT